MGFSASAEVFYGYDLGDMLDPDTFENFRPGWWEIAGDWTEWREVAATKLGWVEVPHPGYSAEFMARYGAEQDWNKKALLMAEFWDSPAMNAWKDSQVDVERILRDAGLGDIELDHYGYLDGEPSFALKVVSSVTRAHDFGSAELPDWLGAEDDWRKQLERAADLLELTAVGDLEPAWILAVSYG